jgi:hypothetical protein
MLDEQVQLLIDTVGYEVIECLVELDVRVVDDVGQPRMNVIVKQYVWEAYG